MSLLAADIGNSHTQLGLIVEGEVTADWRVATDERHTSDEWAVLLRGLLGRAIDEIARHRQGDVGLEQRDSNLAHRRTHVGLGQRTAPPQPIEHTAKAVAQALEHPKKPFQINASAA